MNKEMYKNFVMSFSSTYVYVDARWLVIIYTF